MQLIHHPRAHLHQTMPMPQQLPQIEIRRIRHPDSRKAALQHQLQQQLCGLPIGLLLPHPLGANLGGISDPQLELQVAQPALEPVRVPTRSRPHSHIQVLFFELAVELFGFFAMNQAPFVLQPKNSS
ncbi:MAG: hypothetical protein WCF22_24035 [Candidatus Sulfotelmatobacter sp.]